MTEVNRIVFHFLNPELYEKFTKELSADQFVALARHDQKMTRSLFGGQRVNSQSFWLPIVQRKIKKACDTSQEVRNFLCKAWLAAKKPLVSSLLEFFPFSIKGEATDFQWIGQLLELQKKHGCEAIVGEMIKVLVWTQTSTDDIRILVSILSWLHEDQRALERYVDKMLDLGKKDPTSFLDILANKTEEDNKVIQDLKDKKQEIEETQSRYKSKLEQSRSTSKKDHKDFEVKQSQFQAQEKEAQLNIDSLKTEIAKVENTLGEIQSARNQLEQKYRKVQKKAEYEQNKIGEEISKLHEDISHANSIIAARTSSRNNRSEIRKSVEQQLLAHEHEMKEHALARKAQAAEVVTQRRKKVPATIAEVRDELNRITDLIGRLEPLRKNEIGFVATPSTLDIIERLSRRNFEPPMEVPRQSPTTDDIVGQMNYWEYQAAWNFDKWNNAAIAEYSFWRSRQLQNENAELSAELALSGIFHAELDFHSEQDSPLLLQFFRVIGGVDSTEGQQDDYEDILRELLPKILEQWESRPLIVSFLGQLALVSPNKLSYIFDIADRKSRIFLKRTLVQSFKGFVDLDEYDPSHEITHLIASYLEQNEARLRSACIRWLVQDSVDTMAQNARQDLMTNISQFPSIGHRVSGLLADEFESQVSRPLSKAIRSGVPQKFEDLSLQCFAYSKEIITCKFWVHSVYLWPCVIHLAEQATEANIQARRLFRAALEVSTDKHFYPFNIPGIPCSVEVVITNYGNAEARDLNVLILSSQATDTANVQGGEPTFSVLKPGDKVRHKIQISLKKPTQACILEYIVNWKDSSSMDEERSQTGTLKLLSQKEVDWEKAQNPYSLKSIKDPARLKGRSNVMDTLRRSRDSMDSYYITGQRRTGKSSVAQVYYKELNEKDCHAAIYLWWGDLGTTALAPICQAICYELAGKLRERTPRADIMCPSMTDFSGNPSIVFKRFFGELHTLLPDWKVFIIIDDFDELPASFHETEAGDPFFLLLRALLDQEFVALYLVGSEKLPEILKRQGERLNLTQRCEIDYLKDSSAIDKIIVDPAMGILEFHREAIDEIRRLTAGNPYYASLICSRLFNDMARVKDYYVSKRDVERSVDSMIEEDALSTYQHFWKDGVFLPGSLGERQQHHNAKVLIALSRSQAAEGGPIAKEKLLERDDLYPLSPQDTEYALSSLLDRRVIVEDENGLYVRVPLFSRWLAGSGARAVERSFAEAGLDEVPIDIARGLQNRELIEVAQDLVYQDKEINEVLIADWLSQFGGTSNQVLAFKLLKRLREEGYFNQARMFSAFKEIHKQIVSMETSTKDFAPRIERRSTVNVIVSYLDPAVKSGQACEYAYRKVNHINAKCGISPDKLIDFLAEGNKDLPIIFADDIVGTGGTIATGFQNLSTEMANRGLNVSNYSFYLASVLATKIGQEFVEAATEGAIRIVVGHEIDERLQAFSEKADLFSDESERLEAREMVEKIGKELEPQHPLGRKDGQLLVLFQHGCPNNTLPVFYKSGRTFRGREWRSLFPR